MCYSNGFERFCLICVFFLIASVLVFVPSIPSLSSTRLAVTMVNVHFYNLPNITIGDVQGVTRISFDTWRACYYGNGTGFNLPGICVKATTVTGGQYKPYSITIYNNGQQVTASPAWSIILVAQLFGCLMIVIVTIIVVVYQCCAVNNSSDCDIQYKYENKYPIPDPKAAQPTRWKCGHYRRAITFWLIFSVWLSMAIILAMDLGTYKSIENSMFSLGSGGTQRIETTIGPGLILNIVICGILTLILVLKMFDRGYGTKDKNQHTKPTGVDMPSPWNCSPLLEQCGQDCHNMECYKWCE